MIPVTVNGVELLIKPKCLQDYVDKIDFIKTRRMSPLDLMQGFSHKAQPDVYENFLKMAMHTVYTSSSTVSFEEEVAFDKSEEGFYFELWRCLPEIPKEKWKDGINRARKLWESASKEEKNQLIAAQNATDERGHSKN